MVVELELMSDRALRRTRRIGLPLGHWDSRRCKNRVVPGRMFQRSKLFRIDQTVLCTHLVDVNRHVTERAVESQRQLSFIGI